MTFKKLLTAIAVTAGLCLPVTAWATCSVFTTYTSGQTLTASSLNSSMTTLRDCVNNVLDGDSLTGNLLFHSGVDAVFYTDAGTTISASIDGATGNVVINGGGDLTINSGVGTPTVASIDGATGNAVFEGLTPASISAPCVYFDGGYSCNCSLTYATDTLTITGADAALSALNKCVIGMNNASGKPAAFEITADVTTTFNDASDTDENLFGVTPGVAWASAMPMFLHYCDGSGADYFGFSRNPARIETGNAAGNMAQEGDTDGDSQGDLFIMSSGLTLANEVDRPCVTVGSFQATMTSGNDWAVGTLVAGRDGFGLFQQGVEFTYPTGQNTAQSGTFFVKPAANAPAFATQEYYYFVFVSAQVHINIYLNGDGGTDGSDATYPLLTLPLAYSGTATTIDLQGRAVGQTTIIAGALVEFDIPTGTAVANAARYVDASNTLASLTHAMFSNGARYLKLSGTYQAF